MHRRLIALACFVIASLPLPAAAGAVEDRIVAQLRDQGFEKIDVTRTLLGRVRILAREDDTLREIVLNPATGAILRDYWSEINDEEEDRDDDKDRGRSRKRGKGDGKDDIRLMDSDDD